MTRTLCILVGVALLLGMRAVGQTTPSGATLTNRGATLTTSASAMVDLRGAYVVGTASGQDGRISLAGTFRVTGDWHHEETGTGLGSGPSTGTVALLGTQRQTISGSGLAAFPRLVINNPEGASLATSILVEGTLQLTNGRLRLGSADLWLDTSASITGTFGPTAMIGADGTGMVKKLLGAPGSMLFPVGDETDSVDYSPSTLTFVSGTFAPGAWVGVRVTNAKHPDNPLATGPWLNRYWTLEQDGISSFSCTAVFTYRDADVVGSESGLFGARYHSIWSPGPVADPVANTLTFTGLSAFSDFSGMNERAASATLVVRARAFLQGTWNGLGMQAWLNNSDSTLVLLPLSQPYSDPKVWNYPGTESVPSAAFYAAHPDIVDWVLVELRSGDPAVPPMPVTDRRAGFIRTDGTVVDVDGVSPLAFSSASSGSYYVVIRHRNHLAVMSAGSLALDLSTPLYDFTTSQTQAYSVNTPSDAMKSLGTVYGLTSGDATGDGFIDINDFTEADNNQFNAGYLLYDTNLDGFIDINDFTDADNGQFLGTQVP